jgi:hypothetical protein
MKCRSVADRKKASFAESCRHLSNSVEWHDLYYENWKHGSGSHIDSRWLCNEAIRKKSRGAEAPRHDRVIGSR